MRIHNLLVNLRVSQYELHTDIVLEVLNKEQL